MDGWLVKTCSDCPQDGTPSLHVSAPGLTLFLLTMFVQTHLLRMFTLGLESRRLRMVRLFVLEHERSVYRTRSPQGVSRSFGK